MLDGLGVETGVDLPRWWRPAAGSPATWPARAPAGWSTPWPERRGGVRHNPRMADVVYLHVGAPKTGTTYLQDRLHHNRDAAGRSTACTTPPGCRRHVRRRARPHRPAVGRPPRAGPRRVGRARRPGPPGARHRAGQPRDPRLAPRPTRSTGRCATFGDAEVHVVYSARDMGRQIPAEWQESREAPPPAAVPALPEALQDGRPARLRRCGSGGSTACPTCCSRWTAGIPPERVHLVTVPPPGAARRRAVAPLLPRLRHRPALGARRTSCRTNASLGIDETACCASSTGGSRKTGLDAGRLRARWSVAASSPRSSPQRHDMPPGRCSRLHARAWADEVAEEWVDWVGAPASTSSATSRTCCPGPPTPTPGRTPTAATGRASPTRAWTRWSPSWSRPRAVPTRPHHDGTAEPSGPPAAGGVRAQERRPVPRPSSAPDVSPGDAARARRTSRPARSRSRPRSHPTRRRRAGCGGPRSRRRACRSPGRRARR